LIDKNDEVLILRDVTNPDQKVGELLETYKAKVNVIEAKLNGDFATFKNKLIENGKSRYLFQIDADEYPTEHFIKTLKPYLKKEKVWKCFSFRESILWKVSQKNM
jgi:glycosyltransferase involved in cell wall biosynthesis